MTLADFIKKNPTKIYFFTIFAAVMAYFVQIRGDDFYNLLSLFFLVTMVIVGFELSETILEIPEDGIGPKQKLFMYTFLAGFALIFTYIYPETKNIIHSLSVLIVWVILLAITILIVGRTGLIKRFLKGRERIKLFGILMLIVLLSMLFVAHIAAWLSTVPYLNTVFK